MRRSARPSVLLAGAVAAALALGALPAAAANASPYPSAVSDVHAAAGAKPNQVRVSWHGGSAKYVAIVAGSDAGTTTRFFHSPTWTRAKGVHALTLTVPTRLRAWLGAGSGNPVWVRVAQANSAHAAFAAGSSSARSYRVSPAGVWSFARGPLAAPTVVTAAGAPAAAPTKLRVAELNVQSIAATKGFSAANRWKARAPRVAAQITAAKPDLLLTAELTTTKVDGCTDHPNKGQPYVCRSHSQLGDLAKRLPTLKLADARAYDRAMDRTRSGGKSMTSGEHVFYNPKKLTVLKYGFFAPATAKSDHSVKWVQGLGVSGWSGTNALGPDRWLSWVKFQTKDASHRVFFAVAAHLPAGMSKTVVDGRARESKAMRAAVAKLAGTTPVVLAGDFNSDSLLDAKSPQVDFVRDGWTDAASVTAKAGRGSLRFATANDDHGVAGDFGYPSRPEPRKHQGGRIDYILLKGSPYTYAYRNVLHLHADGSFVKSMRGTDHNMQLAVVGIGDPARAAS